MFSRFSQEFSIAAFAQFRFGSGPGTSGVFHGAALSQPVMHFGQSAFPSFNFNPTTTSIPANLPPPSGSAMKKFIPPQVVEVQQQVNNGNWIKSNILTRQVKTNQMCLTFMKEFSNKSLEEHRLDHFMSSGGHQANPADDFNDFFVVDDEDPTLSNGSSTSSISVGLEMVPPFLQLGHRHVVFNFPNSQQVPGTPSEHAATTSTPTMTFNMPPLTAMSFDQTRMMFTMHFT